MHAAALRVELLLRDVRSLKQKRGRIKSLTHHLTAQFPVAVAEIDHQDLWKRSTLGVATIAAQAGQLERLIHSVVKWLENQSEVEVLDVVTSYLAES
ncbi:MAG: DUF503 domain-containing protein [Acidimicrobiia bacterium]